MSYKIAVASSDHIHIDLNFGGTDEFLIYEGKDNGEYSFLEVREMPQQENKVTSAECSTQCSPISKNGCKESTGCGSSKVDHPKVLLLSDCRCILCKKVGFSIQKQLEKKAIVTFDVEGGIEESLHKILAYFYRIDHHQTLRGIANQL